MLSAMQKGKFIWRTMWAALQENNGLLGGELSSQ
jgi:hypothetical protein